MQTHEDADARPEQAEHICCTCRKTTLHEVTYTRKRHQDGQSFLQKETKCLTCGSEPEKAISQMLRRIYGYAASPK